MKSNKASSSKQSPRKSVSFNVSEAEFNVIMKSVKRSGLSRQKYLLTSAMGKTIYEIVELKPIYRELKRIATDLNELTLLAHQGHIAVFNPIEVTEALEKTYLAINGLYETIGETIASGNTEGYENGNV